MADETNDQVIDDVFTALGQPWEGEVRPGFGVNFLGVKTRDFFGPDFVNPVTEATYVRTSYPVLSDGYLEWLAVLNAVCAARNTFTMLELGAGWAPWTANAYAAALRRGGLRCRFTAVEAEPTHYSWAKLHLADNGVPSVKLIRAAVAPTRGEAWFYVGLPSQWYGQALAVGPRVDAESTSRVRSLIRRFSRQPDRLRAPELDSLLRTLTGDSSLKAYVEKVRTVTLRELLSPYDRVDLVHMDIQGAELDVLRSAISEVDEKVKRIVIGTHSEDVEQGLDRIFHDHAWKPIFQYGLNRTHETPWGTISLVDGVYSYENPHLV